MRTTTTIILLLITVAIQAQQQIELVSLWKECKTECYNDSTLIEKHIGGYGICIIDYECLDPDHYAEVWIHKQPTFEGFMNWLTEKQPK